MKLNRLSEDVMYSLLFFAGVVVIYIAEHQCVKWVFAGASSLIAMLKDILS